MFKETLFGGPVIGGPFPATFLTLFQFSIAFFRFQFLPFFKEQPICSLSYTLISKLTAEIMQYFESTPDTQISPSWALVVEKRPEVRQKSKVLIP